MPSSDPHMQIARKIRSVETAKIELVHQVSEVFRGVQSGNERELAESLGGILAIAYFIGQQLGVELSAIDAQAAKGLPRSLEREVMPSGDYEYVQRYLSSTR